MRQVIEKLEPHELKKYRNVVARWEAAQCCPPDGSLDEAEKRYTELHLFLEELYVKYELDDGEDWRIDPVTGHIVYEAG